MLATWIFLITLHFTGLGGGGDLNIKIQASTEPLCQAIHRIATKMITTPNAVITDCTKVSS